MKKLNYGLNARTESLDFNSLKEEIGGKANISHTHEIGEVNGLEENLQVQASNVTITDSSNKFDATNVEEALLESKNSLDDIKSNLNGHKIWNGTKAEYDEISPKDNNTLYFIKEV